MSDGGGPRDEVDGGGNNPSLPIVVGVEVEVPAMTVMRMVRELKRGIIPTLTVPLADETLRLIARFQRL